MGRLGGLRSLLIATGGLVALGAFVFTARNSGPVAHTAALVAAVWILALPLGATSGWVATRSGAPGARWLWRASLVSAMLPAYVHAAAWNAGFGQQGWWTNRSGTAALVAGFWGAAWVHGVMAVAWVTLVTGVGFLAVERCLEEAAAQDAGPWQVFRRVTMPRALGSLLAAALWVAVLVASEIGVTDFFQVRTLAEVVYVELSLGAEPGQLVPLVASSAAPLLLLLVGAAYASRWWVPRAVWAAPRAAGPPTGGQYRLWSMGVVALALTLMVLVPVGNLLMWVGLTVESTPEAVVRNWSLNKALTTIASAPQRFIQEALCSATLATWVVLLTLATAVPAAWWADRARQGATVVLGAVALALATPGPLVGLLGIGVFNQPGMPGLCWLYDRTLVPTALALTIKAWPIATLILWQAFASLARPPMEVAACDGAPWWRLLWSVALAQRWPAVAAAAWVAMLVAWGDVATSIMLLPPGATTVAVRVFSLLHYGVDDQVAGCLLACVALTSLAWAVLSLLSRRAGRD